MDLIEFLRARLDEDEAAAREAEGMHWRTTSPYLGAVDVDDAELNRSVIMDREGGSMSEETGAHVVRWDPARVLAEVAAKRQVVEAAEWGINAWEMGGEGFAESVAEQVLAAMVQPYADRPGFDPAWLATPA